MSSKSLDCPQLQGKQYSKRQPVVSHISHGRLINAKLVSVFVVSALAAVSHGAAAAKTYGPSLQECRDFAAQFANTCTVPNQGSPAYSSWIQSQDSLRLDTIPSEQVLCPMSKDDCKDETQKLNYGTGQIYSFGGSICRWERQLCVFCLSLTEAEAIGITIQKPEDVQVDAVIRVMSNNMPNHCFDTASPPIPTRIDYHVAFNAQLQRGVFLNGGATQKSLDDYLCNTESFSNGAKTDNTIILSKFGLTINPTEQLIPNLEKPYYRMDEANGIALNGVLFKPAADSDGVDRIWPRVPSGEKLNRVALDQCLGTTAANNYGDTDAFDGKPDLTTDGVYHYPLFSPCIIETVTDPSDLYFKCETDPLCKLSPPDYANSFFADSEKNTYPVGLAKDGRIMYSPFKSDQTNWESCDVDFCNGRWFTGGYGYVMTDFFPYTVGCWGPGQSVLDSAYLFPSCSNYPRQCPDKGYFAKFAYHISAFSIASLAVLMAVLA